MEEILKPYRDLADQLRADLTQNETLQTEHRAFSEDKERLRKAREGIGNAIYAKGKNGLAPLVGKLESVEREEKSCKPNWKRWKAIGRLIKPGCINFYRNPASPSSGFVTRLKHGCWNSSVPGSS
jgi:hypothetical protein